jgi:hypothetical protein
MRRDFLRGSGLFFVKPFWSSEITSWAAIQERNPDIQFCAHGKQKVTHGIESPITGRTKPASNLLGSSTRASRQIGFG